MLSGSRYVYLSKFPFTNQADEIGTIVEEKMSSSTACSGNRSYGS